MSDRLKHLRSIVSYPYRPANLVPAVCDAEVWADGVMKIHVFLFERKDNPGMSVTNAIEVVTSQMFFTLRGHLGLPVTPDDIVWYQQGEDGYDPLTRVDLDWDPRLGQFLRPRWTVVPDPRG